MKYAEFASQLARYPESDLIFEFEGSAIRRGYHLTEVLCLTIDAIDCGGAVDHWSETVLQLVEPSQPQAESFMRSQKATAILQRSKARVPMLTESEVVLEFRPAGLGAAQRFHVTDVQPGGDGQLRVTSVGARTQCKAAERKASACGDGASNGACCASGVQVQSPATASACCGAEAAAAQGQPSRGCCA